MSDGKLAPTARLRFVRRYGNETDPTIIPTATPRYILQQWFAADVPGYMIDPTEGEWRDVPVEGEK
jgi:hypothetical protein